MLTDGRGSGAAEGAHRSSRKGRLLAVAAVLALAGVGFWWRVAGAHEVVLPADSAPRLLGTDSYDHLRRAAELTGTLPPGLAPLPVAAGDWVEPGLFDALLTLPALLAGRSPPSLDRLAAGAAWIPPVLAALSIVALWALAARFLPPADAWLAALLFVLYPGESLDRTTLGFADHHAAEIALTLVALWALVRELQSTRPNPWWRPAVLAAAPTVLLLLVWRGAALTLTLIAAGLVLAAPFESAEGSSVARLARGALRYALGCAALMALVALFRPQLQLGALTTRRAWLAIGFVALASGLLRIAGSMRASGLGAAAPWLVLGVVVLGALALSRSGFGQRWAEALTVPRVATVQEHSAVRAGDLVPALGATALFAIPGLAVALGGIVRRRLDPALVVPLTVAFAWTGVWWRIHDVGYLPPALLAIPAGCLLWGARRLLLARVEASPAVSRRVARALSVGPVGILALAPLWPYGLAAAPATSAARADALLIYRPAAFEAVRWLRERTPAGGAHAVASPWVMGNLIATFGERRPLWARMPTRSAAQWLLAPSEERSLEILALASGGDRVRYALIDGRSCGRFFVAEARNAGIEPGAVPIGVLAQRSAASALRRLDAAYDDALVTRLCFGAEGDWQHYRLRWQSRQRLVTSYRLEGAAAGSARLRLETRSLAPGEAPPAGGVRPSADGRSALYLPRAHAEFRIFEIPANQAPRHHDGEE